MKKHRKKPTTQKEMLLSEVWPLTVLILNCYLMVCAGVLLIGNSCVPFYATTQDENGEETGEDATYEYRAIHRYANEDDHTVTIQFDFQNRTGIILTLVDWNS